MSEHLQDVASAAAPGPAEAPAGPEGPLRIVLFGLPQAGKTALLAALAQVQKEHAAQLDGEVADPSGELEAQRRLYYDEIPRPSDEEISSYPVRFRRPGAPTGGAGVTAEAWLVDSNGHIARDMLQQPLPGDEAELPSGTLPRAVLDADALVLVLDATNPDEDVFTEFGDFLARLEHARAKRSDVTGMPVYAVLSKCDLLARRQEDLIDWIDHLEERKRRAGERLQKELDDGGDRPREFGRLDLRLWATATKRPPLAGSPARPREPYGVAELFRQALGEAETFRRRRVRADRRLTWTVRGLGGLAAGLVVMTLVLLTGLVRHDPSELQRRIEYYRLKEGTDLFDRLNDNLPLLQDRLAELWSFRQSADDPSRTRPEFDELPQELKDYVEERTTELVEYIPYLEKVIRTEFPILAENDQELREREQELKKQLPLPHKEWANTGAGQLRQRRLDELALLRDRADLAEEHYRLLRARGVDLWAFRTRATRPTAGLIDWPAWRDEVRRYEEEASQLPASVQALPPGSSLTPSTILEFERVRQARALALSTVHELNALRDIASALGLLEDPLRPALLVIKSAELTPSEARRRSDRLRNYPELLPSLAGLGRSPLAGLLLPSTFPPGHPLVSAYPEYLEDFTLARVPQAARGEVQRAAALSYRDLLRPVRELVLGEYRRARGPGEEKPAAWKEVATWLDRSRIDMVEPFRPASEPLSPPSDPTSLRPYRRLAFVLARLARPGAEDPIEALARFLKRDEFRATLVGARLTIPSDLAVAPPDLAELVLEHAGRTLKFPLKPEKTSPGGTVYFFEGPPQELVYRPGDVFKATLVLRGGRSFLWNDSRTRTYAFECLSNPPLLVEKDQVEVSERAEGVVLRLDYDGRSLPEIPEALPAVATRPER